VNGQWSMVKTSKSLKYIATNVTGGVMLKRNQ